MNHSSSRRIFGLDVLRSVAILCVMTLHSTDLLISTGLTGKWMDWLAFQTGILGLYGVELFFVLSGFLIGNILLALAPDFKNPMVLPAFWQRRWIRTLPNYFLFLSVNTAIFLVGSLQLPNLLPYFIFLQNWLWAQPSFFAESWSLVVEEWFYLLFPISVFVFHRRLKYQSAFLFSALIFLIIPTILRIIWIYLGHHNWDEEFRKVAILRLDSIMYGVLAAHVKIAFSQFWEKFRYVFLIAGLGILSTVWLYFVNVGFDTWLSKTFLFSVISLGASFLLPFCNQWHASKENIFTHSFRRIALWSYTLYLCSLTVSLIVNIVFLSLGQQTVLLSIAAWFSFYALSFLISAVVYRYFEKPLMGLRERYPISLSTSQDGMK